MQRSVNFRVRDCGALIIGQRTQYSHSLERILRPSIKSMVHHRFVGRVIDPCSRTCSIFGIAASSSEHGNELLDWVGKHDGSVRGVLIHSWQGEDGGAGYGLKASENIHAGQELVMLPATCQLRFQEGRDPSSLKQMMDRIPDELWGAKLALKLLFERIKGDEGHFWPYIKNLPVGFPGLPLFYDQKSIQALEYPPVSSQIIKRCKWLLQFSSTELQQKDNSPFDGSVIDANTLGWAFAAVTSRAFRPGGPKSAGVLLPLIDMCNHSFSPNAKVIGSKNALASDSLSMVAISDIAAGEPILLNYGKLPNDFLLLDYGFVVDDNPYDTVKLSFDVGFVEGAKAVANVGSLSDDGTGSLKILDWQHRMLNDLHLNQDKEVSIIRSSSSEEPPVDERLLAGVRILCATKESDCKIHNLGNWNEDIQNRSWELSSLKTLMGMCIIALSQFSTSVAQDLDLITNNDGDEDLKLALRLRKEKKEILTGAVEVLKQRIQQTLDGNLPHSKKQSKKAKNKPSGKGFGK